MPAFDDNDLQEALQENLKLRRELATGLGDVKGAKLAPVRYRLARILGAVRHALSGRTRRASMSTAVVELMTLAGAREQYANQLRRLDKQELLEEIEQLRRLLKDLQARDRSVPKFTASSRPKDNTCLLGAGCPLWVKSGLSRGRRACRQTANTRRRRMQFQLYPFGDSRWRASRRVR
jgi:hypothetical protein